MKTKNSIKKVWVYGLGLAALIFLSGCANLQSVSKKDFSEGSVAKLNSEQTPKNFYGVSFQDWDTVIWVQLFGVKDISEDAVNINNGMSYPIDLKFIRVGTNGRLLRIVRQNGFDTIDSFIEAYSEKPAIFNGSPYRLLDDKMGHDLFVLARESQRRVFPWPED